MRPYEPHDDVPRLGLSLHDITAIATIIRSYLTYLRKAPPSKQRDEEMRVLEGLQQRVLATVPTEGGIVPLVSEEIQALANAMQGFTKLARQMVAPTPEREELFQQIAEIREHLLRMLAGRNN